MLLRFILTYSVLLTAGLFILLKLNNYLLVFNNIFIFIISKNRKN